MTETVHPLTEFAASTALEVGVGHMLINIADPNPGAEQEYSRWYEGDHFFSSAMMAPFVFAGRRWVAPRALRDLQYSRPGGDFDPPIGGRFAATYWIAPGHLGDYFAWAAGTGPQLDAQGRNFAERRLRFVSFADRIGTVYRDPSGPADVFALHDPPGGLVVQLVDVPNAADRDAAARWLLDAFLPERLAADGASARSVLLFQGAADTSAMRPALQELQRRADNEGRRLMLLWFLDRDPRDGWASQFAALPAMMAEAGRAAVEWTSPYLPARMGTDEHGEA